MKMKGTMGFATAGKTLCFEPVGLGIVAALTPEDWGVEIIDENWKPFEYKKADLVGLSALTASVNRDYEIASIG